MGVLKNSITSIENIWSKQNMWLFIHVLMIIGWSAKTLDLSVEKIGPKTGKLVDAKLSWTKEQEAEFYLLFKRKPGHDWQSISTFDFADNKPVRVLNAFPHAPDCTYFSGSTWYPVMSKMVFATGESLTTSKSGSLKIWMEGGSIDGEPYESLGQNPETPGQQHILVDMIAVEELNENPQLIWNYDVFLPGIWDGSGIAQSNGLWTPVCNILTTSLINELQKYLDSKYSIIASHDSLGRVTGTTYGLGPIRDYFGIVVGGTENNEGFGNDVDKNGVEMVKNWGAVATIVQVVKHGPLVTFPWSVPEEFDVYFTHTFGNIATSDIWIRIDNETTFFEYTHSGSKDFYLTTKNNTAMIQTGHSDANATIHERKVLANLIYFMKQRTNETERYDYTSLDEDPPEPPGNCLCEVYTQRYQFHCDGRDSETVYEYRVEAYNSKNEVVSVSETVGIEMASNFSHFVYLWDDRQVIAKEELVNRGKVSYNETISIVENVQPYFHIMAVDESGNQGPIVDYPVSKCVVITPVFHMEPVKYQTCFITLYLYRLVTV